MASQQRELPTAVAPIPRSSPRRSEWNSATHSINNAFTHLDLLMADCVLNLARFFLLSLSRRFQLSPNSFTASLSNTSPPVLILSLQGSSAACGRVTSVILWSNRADSTRSSHVTKPYSMTFGCPLIYSKVWTSWLLYYWSTGQSWR